MKVREYNTNDGILYEVVPDFTYFIVIYEGDVVYGSGLDITGWDSVPDGIMGMKYVLSTGKILDIPRYKKYLHLVEASTSINTSSGNLYGKNYHYVYIKGFTGESVITHKISLRSHTKDGIGRVHVFKESLGELDKYSNAWREGI